LWNDRQFCFRSWGEYAREATTSVACVTQDCLGDVIAFRASKGAGASRLGWPSVTPILCYDELDGVQDGGMAMDAVREAMPAQIEQQLLDYCGLDTYVN